MAAKIDDIHKEIESVDRTLQDLLVRRAGLVVSLGAEKKRHEMSVIQPEQEAERLCALLSRPRGDLPRAAIVSIWREIIGTAAPLQGNIKVALAAPEENAQEYHDMARDYFGGTVPVRVHANPLTAISALREGEADFVVLPWPPDDIENPWWCHLTASDPAQIVRVVARLPYGLVTGDGAVTPEHRAVILAKAPFLQSGADNSFLFCDLDQTVSRARVVDKIKALGFSPISVVSRRAKPTRNSSQHFVEVEGYVAEADPRLLQILENLESPEGACLALGGYPFLPD